MNPFLLIVGPTASGKSSLALKLAEKFRAAILNCDSLQIFRRLDIGTAKPSLDDRKRVPHFLFDILAPGELLTAGDFRRLALEVLAKELPQRMVIGVGGSGFYIQALEKGMFAVPKPNPAVEAKVRRELERSSLAAMYAHLVELDPDYAESISPNDLYRILRAIIMIRDSGKKVSELRREFVAQPFPYPLIKLGLLPSREELLPRVALRTREMLEQGFVAEVQALIREGFAEWPALQSVGYKECLQYLQGKVDEKKLEALINEKTLQLAKKQRTWFKRDAQIQWLPMEAPEIMAESIVNRSRFGDQ